MVDTLALVSIDALLSLLSGKENLIIPELQDLIVLSLQAFEPEITRTSIHLSH